MERTLIFPVVVGQTMGGAVVVLLLLYTVLEFDVQRLIVQLQAVVKGSRISHSTSSPALIRQSHQPGIVIIIIVI